MSLLDDRERSVLEAIAALTDANPFLPERVDAERRALGADFVGTGTTVWHVEADLDGLNPNLPRLKVSVEALGASVRERLANGARATPDEAGLYQRLVNHLLFQRYEADWAALIAAGGEGQGARAPVAAYPRFAVDVAHFFEHPGLVLPEPVDAPHLFALGFQIRRAFHHTFRQILGGSMPAARLRAAVWQSIFTADFARYRRALFNGMVDLPTLIVGESGTGKELVARAIALSSYVRFDPKRRAFAADWAASFHPLNLSALSPTLVESELFGHRRGAFTGALEDREGWLESCPAEGSVFLDEIGELEVGLQVKLLRVLQTRSFQRIGETQERSFPGKIVAATNRDLPTEMRAGRFRPDFYYRLCADLIRTPTLREQLDDDPGSLHDLVLVQCRRIVGADEAERLADEVESFVAKALGPGYAWPGNVRELEQCVHNVLIRGAYQPVAWSAPEARDDLAAIFAEGTLRAEDLLRRYCTHVYARVGSYEETARRLGIDRRTVKSRIDRELLARLRGG